MDQGVSKTEAREFPDQVQLKFEGLEFSSNSRDGGGISRSVSGNSRPSPGAFLAGALAGVSWPIGKSREAPRVDGGVFLFIGGAAARPLH